MCGLRVDTSRVTPRHRASAATPTTSGRPAICAPRAPRSAICTTIRTDCAPRWSSGATEPTSRCRWDDAFAEAERVLRPILDRARRASHHGVRRQPGGPQPGPRVPISVRWSGMASAAGMGPYYSPGTVDQWPLNVVGHPAVRRHVERADPGSRPHRPSDDRRRQPRGLAGIDALGAGCGGPSVGDPQSRRHGGRPRPAPHRDRAARLGVGADPTRAPTPWFCSRSCARWPPTDCCGRTAHLHEQGARARRGHRAGRAVHPRGGRRPQRHPGRRPSAGWPHDLAAASNPVLYSRIGACTQEFGTLATWLVFVLNTALGAVDRPGGALFPKPAVYSPMFMKPPDQTGERWDFGRFASPRARCRRGSGPVPGQLPGRGDPDPRATAGFALSSPSRETRRSRHRRAGRLQQALAVVGRD